MLRRILVYITFLIACLTIAFAFVSADTYIQLVAASVLYPLLAYAALKLFPRKHRGLHLAKISSREKITQLVGEGYENTETGELVLESIENADKREFLRLVGIAGVSFFVYSILNKRAEASFFGKVLGPSSVQVEDSSGNPIDPAKEQPTDGYQISDLDEFDQSFIYYGCTKPDGSWYIMQQDPYTGAFRYIKGQYDYPTNWQRRRNLAYDYFYNVFSQ